jgi:uncharacterized protein YndB with AHSA1/START domain
MTRQKPFKSRVRARMDKTGERYTAARRQLLDRPTPTEPEPLIEPEPPTEPTGLERPAPARGIRALQFSDAAVRERTGRTWTEWLGMLDDWGAARRKHPEIARWLVNEHGVDGWWSQSLTVRYEQERGLRRPGQTSDGFYSASASKTIAAPVERLFAAFTDAKLRRRWLPGAKLTVRTANDPKTLRADIGGAGRIAVGFVPKANGKAQVSLLHERLPDAEEAGRMKVFWRERLAELQRLLES